MVRKKRKSIEIVLTLWNSSQSIDKQRWTHTLLRKNFVQAKQRPYPVTCASSAEQHKHFM